MVLLWAQTESMIKHRILGVQILRQSQVNVLRDKMDVHSVYIYVYLDIYIYIHTDDVSLDKLYGRRVPKKNTPSVAPLDISAPITIAIGRLILDPNGPVIGGYTCQYIPL